jgi:serine/threonine protein kinase
MSVPKDLMDFYTKICQARSPEEIFGELNSGDPMEALKKSYHANSFACHPNFYAGDSESTLYAEETFKSLHELFEEASKKIANGTYGKPDAPSMTSALFDIKTKKQLYRVYKHLATGDYASIFYAEALDKDENVKDKVCLKVIEDPKDNPLITNEMEVMKKVIHKSLPVYLDRFKTKDKQEALVIRHIEGFDLVTIKSVYPNGVTQEHLCWIMERCLSALGFMHYNDVLHCNLEPGNIIVRPGDHNCFLIDFLFSVIKPTSKSKFQVYTEGFSPPEVLKKKPPSYKTDLYSLGKCFLFLAGGNLDNNWLPTSINPNIRNFILGFIEEDTNKRTDDAWGAYHELRKIREYALGPKKFLEFKVV